MTSYASQPPRYKGGSKAKRDPPDAATFLDRFCGLASNFKAIIHFRHGRACHGHPRMRLRHAHGTPHVYCMQGGWVYMMTNRPNGTLYIGVTSDLARRAWEHREGVADGFTKRYGLKRLVWFERYEDIRDAIQREKTMKHWPRAWKVRVILAANPRWEELYERLT